MSVGSEHMWNKILIVFTKFSSALISICISKWNSKLKENNCEKKTIYGSKNNSSEGTKKQRENNGSKMRYFSRLIRNCNFNDTK